MDRKMSLSSTAVSTDGSLYALSRSQSPISAYTDEHKSAFRHSVHSRSPHYAPYPQQSPNKHESECTTCLAKGELVVVQAGKPCEQCGNKQPKSGSVPRRTRKKRTDRAKFSRYTNNDSKPEWVSKEEGEGGRRYEHSYLIALLQNHHLTHNPKLPEVARGTSTGWKPLKSNNVSDDIQEQGGITPLGYNKSNIFETSLLVMQDDVAIQEDAIMERRYLEDAMRSLLESSDVIGPVRDFLVNTIDRDWATKLELSHTQRGAEGFRRPFHSRARL